MSRHRCFKCDCTVSAIEYWDNKGYCADCASGESEPVEKPDPRSLGTCLECGVSCFFSELSLNGGYCATCRAVRMEDEGNQMNF